MLRAFLLLILFSLSQFAWADLQAIPELQQRVTDLTATLSQSQTNNLTAKLAQLEETKGSQLAVLIVSSTQPEAIEEYAFRVVEKWKLGRKDIDDGVLLLIAKQDRTMRIEVGYGLEGVIPDVTAGRVIREYITPSFRQGDFYAGIDSGVQRLIALINGELLPPPSWSQGESFVEDDIGGLFMFSLFSIFFVNSFASLLGRFVTSVIAGGIVAGVVFMTGYALTFYVVAGIVAFLFSLIFLGNRSSSYRDGGGFGGGFGGGGGGGGFGGGGGGFGGGGASGGW